MYKNMFFFQASKTCFLPLEKLARELCRLMKDVINVQWCYRLQLKTRREIHYAPSLRGSMLDDFAPQYAFIVSMPQILPSSIGSSSASGHISHFPSVFVSPHCLSLRVTWHFLCGHSFANRC